MRLSPRPSLCPAGGPGPALVSLGPWCGMLRSHGHQLVPASLPGRAACEHQADGDRGRVSAGQQEKGGSPYCHLPPVPAYCRLLSRPRGQKPVTKHRRESHRAKALQGLKDPRPTFSTPRLGQTRAPRARRTFKGKLEVSARGFCTLTSRENKYLKGGVQLESGEHEGRGPCRTPKFASTPPPTSFWSLLRFQASK